MKPFSLLTALGLSLCAVVGANAQDRDLHSERLVLDDDAGNTITLQTPTGPITGGTLLLPDPAGASATLLTTDGSGNATLEGALRLQETGGGTEYVGLQAPPAVGTSLLWTLPAADGASGEVLTTNGAGVLSWTPGGGTVTHNATLVGNGTVGSPLGINLGNSNTWTANQTFASTFLITANARIAMTNSDNNSRDLRIQEPSGTGTQYIGIRAPSVTNNGNYVWPAVVGSTGQVMTITATNGIDSATMGWTTPPGVSLSAANTWTGAQTFQNNPVAITNNDNVARELRLYEPSGSGVNYTAIKAQAQAGDITYTLPNTAPTAANEVLQVQAVAGNNATLAWGTIGGGAILFARTGVIANAGNTSYNVQAADDIVGVDMSAGTNFTVNLPPATTAGEILIVKIEAYNNALLPVLTLQPGGGNTIDGNVNLAFGNANGVRRLYSSGTGRWFTW